MVRQYLLFIFSLIFAFAVQSQEVQNDSVIVSSTPFIKSAVYVDYGKLFTIPSSFETKYEGGLELTFYGKLPIILEVGQASLSPEGAFSNGTYESKGLYYRVGLGYVGQFKSKIRMGISVRFAQSMFDENGRIFIESPSGAQETFIQNINRSDLTASWYEVVMYSDRELSDLFSIGLNLRFRILADYDEQLPIDVYAIPGYGRAFDNTIPAANFFLKVTF